MTPKLKAKWLAALRSGNYTQGQGVLNKDNKMCCLGVLCDVAGYKWKSWDGDPNFKICSAGRLFIEKEKVRIKLGLPNEIHEVCYSLNDGTIPNDNSKYNIPHRRHSFKEIADWLEENLT